MNARAFLVRGLLAGLLAGLVAFAVASQVGEPPLEAAIALEGGGSSAEAPHDDGHSHTHTHAEAEPGTEVSRGTQRTWGLLTGTLAVGVALGGLVALVAAGVAGRMGRVAPAASTAVVSAVGFVSYALVPFLKYPATPPGVGDASTIGDRTGAYFGFVLVSLLMAVAATVLATRLAPRIGAYAATVGGVAAYLLVMAVAGQIFPTVDEVGDFPAGTLWSFRIGALATLTTVWVVIGVVLTGLVLRLQDREAAQRQRRDLAASL